MSADSLLICHRIAKHKIEHLAVRIPYPGEIAFNIDIGHSVVAASGVVE